MKIEILDGDHAGVCDVGDYCYGSGQLIGWAIRDGRYVSVFYEINWSDPERLTARWSKDETLASLFTRC